MKKQFVIRYLAMMVIFAGCGNNNVSAQQPRSPDTTTSNILIAYFSCTGNTRSIAVHIANTLNATLYEIKPQVPYTTEDLNWRNSSSRSSMEMNNSSTRPGISGTLESLSNYDIVFLGYPIWFGQAPRIINTFLESYDFSGKTIIPFCTSGSSGIGSSATNLHRLVAANTKWLSGTRFSGNASRNTVGEWVNNLNIR